ncbi:unnamed protein product, partial [Musa acuminata subsp. burmannicoides]
DHRSNLSNFTVRWLVVHGLAVSTAFWVNIAMHYDTIKPNEQNVELNRTTIPGLLLILYLLFYFPIISS